MARGLDSPGRSANSPAADVYDDFAQAYAADTESNLINGYYARPAILDLAGEITGRRILDVGCGAGPLLDALRGRGAGSLGPAARSGSSFQFSSTAGSGAYGYVEF